jgi:hypothetical protein
MKCSSTDDVMNLKMSYHFVQIRRACYGIFHRATLVLLQAYDAKGTLRAKPFVKIACLSYTFYHFHQLF